MLKKLVNEARIDLRITTTGPLLIKSGATTMSSKADMTPVLIYRYGQQQVYLPGSSLKGVFRSHLEKICRTLHEGVVCNPFLKLKDVAEAKQKKLQCSPEDYANVSCSDKFEVRGLKDTPFEDKHQNKWRLTKKNEDEDKLSPSPVYADSCPVCRLFGSTAYIGRISIGDAYLVDAGNPQPTEVRDLVGIDRLTGGAAGSAKFDQEVVSTGVMFKTEIYLRNFETWQLGMLMLVIQDMDDELMRIGFGRSRGLGAVKGRVEQAVIAYPGKLNGKAAHEVWGLGQFLAGEARDERYGTQANDVLTVDPAPIETRRGIRLLNAFDGASLIDLQEKSIAAFVEFIDNWSVPERMKIEYLRFGKELDND